MRDDAAMENHESVNPAERDETEVARRRSALAFLRALRGDSAPGSTSTRGTASRPLETKRRRRAR